MIFLTTCAVVAQVAKILCFYEKEKVEQSQNADKGWSSSLGVGRRTINSM
jgi:hypothetical protein